LALDPGQRIDLVDGGAVLCDVDRAHGLEGGRVATANGAGQVAHDQVLPVVRQAGTLADVVVAAGPAEAQRVVDERATLLPGDNEGATVGDGHAFAEHGIRQRLLL